MMSICLAVSATLLICQIISSFYLAFGISRLGHLGEKPVISADPPRVSIIVAACNEEKCIESTVVALMGQEYTNLEVIAVNDRSTDNTGTVLSDLQKLYPQLVVETVRELPDGWMGKANALSLGAKIAGGRYLIFTDGDVQMEKTVVSRAVHHMKTAGLDHLTLLFKNTSPGLLLNSLIIDSGIGLLLMFRPWRVRSKDSGSFIGVGAFNMVEKSAYKEVGGHQGIKMHPIDDMMLGKIIKENGLAQDCLMAEDLVTIAWYESLGAMINGLLKNVFSVVHYRLLALPVVIFLALLVGLFPLLGLILGSLSVKVCCLLFLGVRLLTYHVAMQRQGLPWYYLSGVLAVPFISCYIFVKAAYVTNRDKGIWWRGSFYPLGELKASRPLLF